MDCARTLAFVGRTLTAAKVTLMEDGVLMAPAPYSAPAAYYFPLTTRLTGVEVFKGPASIQYGPNTIGGALNLVTRAIPARGDAGSIDLSLGGYGGRKVHAYYGHGANHYGVLFEFAQIGSDGFKELDDGGDTGYDKADYMLKFRLNNDLAAEVHHRLELKLGYATELSHETYLGLSDEDFKKTPYRRYAASQLGDMSWSRVQAKLSYDLAIGEHIEFNLTGYRHEFERDWIKLNGFGEGAITGSGARVTIEDVLRDPGRFDSYSLSLSMALTSGRATWQNGSPLATTLAPLSLRGFRRAVSGVTRVSGSVTCLRQACVTTWTRFNGITLRQNTTWSQAPQCARPMLRPSTKHRARPCGQRACAQ